MQAIRDLLARAVSLAIGGLLLALTVLLPVRASELRVGTASVVITPPTGMPMAGSYSLRLSEGVMDELRAKTLVLDKDGVRVALVACDLVALSDEIVIDARKLIEEQTGIPAHHVMISATHTHSGPFIPGRASFDKYFGGELEVSKQFRRDLPVKIAESVRQAAEHLEPAAASAGVGSESAVSFNRRYLMKDGSVRTNPGLGNPDVVRPVGPIDPDIAIVYFKSLGETEGKPLATYVNHALHAAVTGGRRFSSDFPGVIARLLGDVKGEDMLTLFTAGTCGNVNHLNVGSKERRSGFREANRIGTILAAEVLKTYDRMEPVEDGPLQVRHEIVKLPLFEITEEDVRKARAVIADFGKPDGPGTRPLADAFRGLDVAERNGKPIEKEVQIITLGDQVAWVSLPGEIFVELGLLIKEASPFPYTIVAELANGWVSYVPDRKAYPEGSYEVMSARCAPGCGEKMVDAAVRMLIEMHDRTQPNQGFSFER